MHCLDADAAEVCGELFANLLRVNLVGRCDEVAENVASRRRVLFDRCAHDAPPLKKAPSPDAVSWVAVASDEGAVLKLSIDSRVKNISPVLPVPVSAGLILLDLTHRVSVDRSTFSSWAASAEPTSWGVLVFGMSKELHIAQTYAMPNTGVSQKLLHICISLCNNESMSIAHAGIEDRLTFGKPDRLNKALEFSGISSNEMAEHLDVSRTTISNYIHGRTEPKRSTLRDWAMRTGVPLEWLESGKFPTEVGTSDYKALVSDSFREREKSPHRSALTAPRNRRDSTRPRGRTS